MVVRVVNESNNVSGRVREIDDRRVRVEATSVHLVAILDFQFEIKHSRALKRE